MVLPDGQPHFEMVRGGNDLPSAVHQYAPATGGVRPSAVTELSAQSRSAGGLDKRQRAVYAGITTVGAKPNFFARRTNLRSSNEAMLAHDR